MFGGEITENRQTCRDNDYSKVDVIIGVQKSE